MATWRHAFPYAHHHSTAHAYGSVGFRAESIYPHAPTFTPPIRIHTRAYKMLNSELIPSPRGAVVSEWPHATVVSPGCEIPVGSKMHTPPPVRSLALIGTSSRVI